MTIRVSRATLGESGVVIEIGPFRPGSTPLAGHKEILPPDYFDALLAWLGVRIAPKESGTPAVKVSSAPADHLIRSPRQFRDALRGIFPGTTSANPIDPGSEVCG